MQAIFKSFIGTTFTEKQELFMSKALTVFWGTVCTIFAFFVGDISDSIIVSMNKIGSLANGPILGVFLLGILTKRANGIGAISGLVLGFVVNALFWIFIPQVSWPWWNMIGCLVCFATGILLSSATKPVTQDITGLTYSSFKGQYAEEFKVDWKKYYYILAAWGVVIFAICYML